MNQKFLRLSLTDNYINQQVLQHFYKMFFWFLIALTLLYIFLRLYLKKLFKPLGCLVSFCHSVKVNNYELPHCQGGYEVNQLNDAISHLVQTNQNLCSQKQDIYKEAAHELKSPIAILKARLSLYKQNSDANKAEFVSESLHDIQQITQKLKELLFLKEIEWEMSQRKHIFHIKEQCQLIRDAFKPILERKNISIVNMNSDDFELNIHANAIQKVMQAIFENIFYYAKNGTVIETTIDAKQRSLTVVNEIGGKSDATLFSSSLGEKIIKRLATKLRYTYVTHKDATTYTTSITFYE